jgi:hypothetical protein
MTTHSHSLHCLKLEKVTSEDHHINENQSNVIRQCEAHARFLSFSTTDHINAVMSFKRDRVNTSVLFLQINTQECECKYLCLPH